MKKKLIIIGAGGCGREVAQIAMDVQDTGSVDWELYGFIDDNPRVLDGYKCDIQLLGSIQEWAPKEEEVFICAIGDPSLREKLGCLLETRNANFINLIHPTSIIAPSAVYEHGLVVYPYTVISVNTKIGKHVLINLHNAIGHDAIVGDYSVLSSFCDITGHVHLGKKVFLGSRVSIVPGAKIGDSVYIGLGSVVVASIKSGKRVFGNPAKSLNI